MRIALRLVVILILVSTFVVYRAFQRDSRDRSLYEAVQQGDIDSVRELLALGASANSRPGKPAPLAIAIQQQQNEIAKALIDAGADGIPDRYICTAILAKNAHMLGEFVKRGADINRPCEMGADGFTPLMLAVDKSSEDVVRMLLKSGADPDKRYSGEIADFVGETALTRCVITGNTRFAQLLLAHGADPSIVFNKSLNLTPLIIAASTGNSEMVKALLANGADPNAAAANGFTAYHNAAVVLNRGDEEPAPGARAQGWRPPKPTHLKEIMQLLKAAGAKDCRVPDKDGNLPGTTRDSP